MNRDLLNTVTLAAARGLKIPVTIVSTALLARLLGPEGVGVWAMVMAAGALLHSAFMNWTHAIAVRFGCEEWERRRSTRATTAIRVPLLAGGAALSAAVLLFVPAAWVERLFSLSGDDLWIVLAYTISVWMVAESRSVMQITSRFRQLAFIPIAVELAGAILLGAVLLFGENPDRYLLLAALAAAMAVTALVPTVVEWFRTLNRSDRPEPLTLRDGVIYAWPLIPSFILGYISYWFDHLLLQAFFSSREVGIFQVGYQLMILLASLSAPIATVVLPRLITRQMADPAAVDRFVRDVIPTVIVLWFPLVSAAVAIAPAFVVPLYGAEFAEAEPVLAVLCAAVPGTILTSLYGTLFSLQGRFGWVTVYLGVMAAVNVGLSFALIPSMGIMGAAIGTSAAYLVSQAVYVADQHRHTGTRPAGTPCSIPPWRCSPCFRRFWSNRSGCASCSLPHSPCLCSRRRGSCASSTGTSWVVFAPDASPRSGASSIRCWFAASLPRDDRDQAPAIVFARRPCHIPARFPEFRFSTPMLLTLAVILVIAAGAAILRLVPHWLAPHGIGVDHWYWKAYIETYRRTRRFPPELPQFMLDKAQWYPPVFPLLIAHLPDRIFQNYSAVLAIVIDILRLVLVSVACWWYVADIAAVAVVAGVYALTPILVTYNVQLNPRGLGALLLDAAVLAAIFSGGETLSVPLLAAAVIAGGVILLTHKMTTQLAAFILLGAFAASLDWRYPAIAAAAVAAALILSGGFYVKVARAHWDIVKFWNRHWDTLTAHPVRESPLYREAGDTASRSYHRPGLRGWLRRGVFLTAFNPWAWGALLTGGIWLWLHPDDRIMTLLTAWVALVLLFSVLTTVVPFLKCLGNGYLYLYNAAAPACLILGIVTARAEGAPWIWPVLAALLLLSGAALAVYLNEFRKSRTVKLEAELAGAIDFLKQRPDGPVMCMPQHWHDVVAYFSGKPVLFGGHGYGFQLLEPIFPILRHPIGEIVERHGVRYLVTHDGYLPESFIADLPPATVTRFGDYQVYEFDAG
ncbi:MAG: lipopolysaccharide biosynthesis protein [Minwuia sp.]|uniref:lipopolysaccharide biosynthesis protein n=1 Tax=Minwuia sp. TaxID=2493630 RepID=UPI003A8BBC36